MVCFSRMCAPALQWLTTYVALYEWITNYLSNIEPFCAVDARVTLRFRLNGRPNTSDPTPTLGEKLAKGSPAIKVLESFFHIPTMSGLATDQSLSWPKQGHLKVQYLLSTPLCCAADGHWDMKEDKGPIAEWELVPTHDEVSFRGFFPKFVGILEVE